MKTLLQNLFAPTVNSLTASLQNTVARLEELAERRFDKADALRSNAQTLVNQALAQEAEAAAAVRVADRIGKLFA